MKKQIRLLLILFVLLSSNVYAENVSYTPLVDSLETISAEDIPQHIQPLEFETKEELEEYLSTQLSSNNSIKTESMEVINPSESLDNLLIYATRSSGSSSHQTSTIPASEASLNLKTLYSYEQVPEMTTHRFTQATGSMSLTGFTLELDLRDISCLSTISSRGSSITTTGTCTIDYYFIIDGLVKFWSDDFDMEHMVFITSVI